MAQKFYSIVLFILILFSYTALADETTLTVGDITEESGHIIKLLAVNPDKVIVDVDGIKKIISLNNLEIINEVEITPIEIVYTGSSADVAKLIITARANLIEGGSCGNDVCDNDEDKSLCCTDCGCESGYSCVNNDCLKNECSTDEECYPSIKDYCILDKCTGKPKKCSHTQITGCVINDKCCPQSCYYPADPDCPSTKIDPNAPKVTEEPKEEIIKENLTNDVIIKKINKEKDSVFKRIIKWFKNLFS